MAPTPSEIQVVNHRGQTFRARPTGIRPSAESYQYRIEIPGIAFSLVVVNVTESELREHLLSGKPVQIRAVT
jgi:hypothetical protein